MFPPDSSRGAPGARRHHHRGPAFEGGSRPFGPRGMFGRGHFGGPGVRRGEIRPLILAALARKPMHGYEVIGDLEARSGGRWRPSAGSVYPTLQQLADEGLVTSEEVEGRRVYHLTDAGREAAAAAPERRWSRCGPEAEGDLRRLAMQFVAAAVQVQRAGSPRARDEAAHLLVEARRQLYRLLAEDDAAGGAEPAAGDIPPAGAADSPR